MDIRDKAERFRALRNDDRFQEVIAEIRDAQTSVFLNAGSSKSDRKEAHEIIRALAAIEQVIDAAIGAETMLDKKEGQHRASD